MKSIGSISARFERELTDLVREAWRGNGAITRDMRALVKGYVEDAYIEGLKTGDVPADEMTGDDMLMIIELDTTQQDFVRNFVADVRAAKTDTAARDGILARIGFWAASIEAAGMAGLMSAKRNEMVTWRLGKASEHCATCSQLNGKRHRRKWFADRNYYPGTPGANLDCQGFNCACTLG